MTSTSTTLKLAALVAGILFGFGLAASFAMEDQQRLIQCRLTGAHADYCILSIYGR